MTTSGGPRDIQAQLQSTLQAFDSFALAFKSRTSFSSSTGTGTGTGTGSDVANGAGTNTISTITAKAIKRAATARLLHQHHQQQQQQKHQADDGGATDSHEAGSETDQGPESAAAGEGLLPLIRRHSIGDGSLRSGEREKALKDVLMRAHKLNVVLRQKLDTLSRSVQATAIAPSSAPPADASTREGLGGTVAADANLQQECERLDEDVSRAVQGLPERVIGADTSRTPRPASALAALTSGPESSTESTALAPTPLLTSPFSSITSIPMTEEARFVRAHLKFMLDQRDKELRLVQNENAALRERLRVLEEQVPQSKVGSGSSSDISLAKSPNAAPIIPVNLAQEHIALRQHFTKVLTERLASLDLNAAKLPKKVLFHLNQLQSALISEASQRQTERMVLNSALLATEQEACERFIGVQLLQMKLDRALAELDRRKQIEREVETKVFEMLRRQRMLEREVATLKAYILDNGLELPKSLESLTPAAAPSPTSASSVEDDTPVLSKPAIMPTGSQAKTTLFHLPHPPQQPIVAARPASQGLSHSSKEPSSQLPQTAASSPPVMFAPKTRPHGVGLISGSLPRTSTQRRPSSSSTINGSPPNKMATR